MALKYSALRASQIRSLENAVKVFREDQPVWESDAQEFGSIGLYWSITDGLVVVDPFKLSDFLEYVRDNRSRPLSHPLKAACGLIEDGLDKQLVHAIRHEDNKRVYELQLASSAVAPLLGQLEPTGEYVTHQLEMLVDAVSGKYETQLLELRARGLFTDLSTSDPTSPSSFHLEYVKSDNGPTDNWPELRLADPNEVQQKWFAMLEPIRQISHLVNKRYALVFAEKCLDIAFGHLDIARRDLDRRVNASHLGDALGHSVEFEADMELLDVVANVEVEIDSSAAADMETVFDNVEQRIADLATGLTEVRDLALKNGRGL